MGYSKGLSCPVRYLEANTHLLGLMPKFILNHSFLCVLIKINNHIGHHSQKSFGHCSYPKEQTICHELTGQAVNISPKLEARERPKPLLPESDEPEYGGAG